MRPILISTDLRMENGSRGWPRRHASHKRDDAQRRRRAAHMIACCANTQLSRRREHLPGRHPPCFQPCSSPSAAASSLPTSAARRGAAPRCSASTRIPKCELRVGRECPTKTFIKRTLWSTARTHLPSLRRSLAGVCVCAVNPPACRPTPHANTTRSSAAVSG